VHRVREAVEAALVADAVVERQGRGTRH